MPAEVTQNEEVIDKSTTDAANADTSTTQDADKAKDEGAPKGEEQEGEQAAPKTALEAAKRVMAKEEKDASDKSHEGPKGTTEDGKPAAEKPKAEEHAADDDKDVPASVKNHPSYRKVASENRILKVAKEKNETAIRDLEAKAKEYEPKLKIVADLTTFIKTSNLSSEDFQSGLQIMRAIRNDPEAAYKMLKPVYEQLESMIGVTLPADIAGEVEAGTITRERAQELARARAAASLATSRARDVEARTAQDAEERARQAEEAEIRVVTDTLNAVEAEWEKTDPDAAKLKPMVQEIVLVDGGRNPPRNAEQSRALFNAAVKKAKDRIAGFVPAPRPKDGNLPPGGPSTSVAQIPKTSLDAVKAALALGD